MHTVAGAPTPVSPYASMSVPSYDRAEGIEHSSLAHREFEALTSGPSASGIALKTRESDRAHVEKVAGTALAASKASV
ncbi:hypothetical protein JCM10207_000644 [Rhodosporidiobolus poonsookiae]